jgi:hypothetical protein
LEVNAHMGNGWGIYCTSDRRRHVQGCGCTVGEVGSRQEPEEFGIVPIGVVGAERSELVSGVKVGA